MCFQFGILSHSVHDRNLKEACLNPTYYMIYIVLRCLFDSEQLPHDCKQQPTITGTPFTLVTTPRTTMTFQSLHDRRQLFPSRKVGQHLEDRERKQSLVPGLIGQLPSLSLSLSLFSLLSSIFPATSSSHACSLEMIGP